MGQIKAKVLRILRSKKKKPKNSIVPQNPKRNNYKHLSKDFILISGHSGKVTPGLFPNPEVKLASD